MEKIVEAAKEWHMARRKLMDIYDDPGYKFDAKTPLPTKNALALGRLGKAWEG